MRIPEIHPATGTLMLALLTLLALSPRTVLGGGTSAETPAADRDSRAVVDHIRTIFQAYIERDLSTIRDTHSTDWTGFQGPSSKIERGIDDYMVNAHRSLAEFRGTGYEILDTEVQLHGDLALVYYVARYDYVDKEGHAGSLGLRALDVYRRDADGWIQCGSHIATIPGEASWRTPE